MKTLLAVSCLLFFGCTQITTDRPYQLNGEGPGMTLDQFRMNHPNAFCTVAPNDENLSGCNVYEGVSFAGVKATSNNSCKDFKPGPNQPVPDWCHTQGIYAEFIDGKMTALSYGVAKGMLPTVVETLKKQYGKPNEEGRMALWSNSVSALTVLSIGTKHSDGAFVDTSTFITVRLKSAMPHFVTVPKPKS
jgi:hypothetical protein